MAVKITHPFVSAKADGPDSTEVKPSDWNADHVLETDGGGGTVLGRDTTGPGPIQELPLAYTLAGGVGKWIANVVGSFGIPRGTSAQRTAAPANGEVRFNIDLNVPEMWIAGSWQPLRFGPEPVGVVTGMVMGWYLNTLPAGGWLFLNGQTIGPTGSGADHAGDDYEDLFTHMWNLPNAQCPVTPGGRGADAATDWAAGKKLQLTDERGRTPAGANTMGGLATNNMLPFGDILGNTGGTATHTHGANSGGPTDVVGRGDQGGGLNVASQFHGHAINVFADSSVQPTIIRNAIIKL